jgi:hypothetical protein
MKKKNTEFTIFPGTDPGYFYPALREKGEKDWIIVYGIWTKAEAMKLVRRWKAELRLDLSGLKRKMLAANAAHLKTGRKLDEATKAYNRAVEEADNA